MNYKINKKEIIQEGLQNLKLIDNKKFVIRAYIIIFNNKIYLSKYGNCQIIGDKYSISNPNNNNQVGLPKIEVLPLHETVYSSYIYKIRDALKI